MILIPTPQQVAIVSRNQRRYEHFTATPSSEYVRALQEVRAKKKRCVHEVLVNVPVATIRAMLPRGVPADFDALITDATQDARRWATDNAAGEWILDSKWGSDNSAEGFYFDAIFRFAVERDAALFKLFHGGEQ